MAGTHVSSRLLTDSELEHVHRAMTDAALRKVSRFLQRCANGEIPAEEATLEIGALLPWNITAHYGRLLDPKRALRDDPADFHRFQGIGRRSYVRTRLAATVPSAGAKKRGTALKHHVEQMIDILRERPLTGEDISSIGFSKACHQWLSVRTQAGILVRTFSPKTWTLAPGADPRAKGLYHNGAFTHDPSRDGRQSVLQSQP